MPLTWPKSWHSLMTQRPISPSTSAWMDHSKSSNQRQTRAPNTLWQHSKPHLKSSNRKLKRLSVCNRSKLSNFMCVSTHPRLQIRVNGQWSCTISAMESCRQPSPMETHRRSICWASWCALNSSYWQSIRRGTTRHKMSLTSAPAMWTWSAQSRFSYRISLKSPPTGC